jgi:hypothetical protein
VLIRRTLAPNASAVSKPTLDGEIFINFNLSNKLVVSTACAQPPGCLKQKRLVQQEDEA